MAKVKLKKNDKVIVITGKDKGRVGTVLDVFAKESKILVSGVGLVKKHQKVSKQNHAGGIVEVESKIAISNVAFVDSATNKPSKIGYKLKDDGSKVRVSKRTGEVIADN